MSQPEILQLTIQGMHCGACVNRVTTALGKVAGIEVRKVEVGSAELFCDPQVATPDEVTAAVERIGFAACIAGK
jgi:copper chaperone/Cu+-exporting ATPase